MSRLKTTTIRKRTEEYLETANSWQEYYDIGSQIVNIGRLIKNMASHMADMQRKIDLQAEELRRREMKGERDE